MELAKVNNNIVAAEPLQFRLFDEFIAFIDRPGRTQQTYIINLRQFAAWLCYSNISQPQRQDIISYRQYLTTEHEAIKLDAAAPNKWAYRTDSKGNRIIVCCKPSTVKQYLQSVRQFFKWTASEGLYPNIAENIHAPKVREDIHKKEALSAADVLAIEKHIEQQAQEAVTVAAANKKDTKGRIDRATEQGKRLFAMYMLAVNCGLRTIEINRANIKDLEIKNGVASLYVYGKGHTEADTKKILAPGVYAALKDYLDARTDSKTGSSPLFVSTGNRSKGQRIATTTISKMLKKAMIDSGYNSERLTAHSLRHTTGTAAMKLTGNIYNTQQYMRHANPGTTEIYLHCDNEKQDAEIANKIFNYYHNIEEPSSNQEQLQKVLASMTAEQLKYITNIAAAMAF